MGKIKDSKELKKNYDKFFEGFDKCPICNGKMFDTTEVIIKEARDATVLIHCPDCEILIGRYT